jgi:hypothetical protein
MKESLSESLSAGENPNTASFRYLMLIDPTNTEASISLLFALGICKQEATKICWVGDFDDDANDLAK